MGTLPASVPPPAIPGATSAVVPSNEAQSRRAGNHWECYYSGISLAVGVAQKRGVGGPLGVPSMCARHPVKPTLVGLWQGLPERKNNLWEVRAFHQDQPGRRDPSTLARATVRTARLRPPADKNVRHLF